MTLRLIVTLAFLLFASPAFAQLSCSRSIPGEADFAACISPSYAPTAAMIDNTPPAINPLSRYQWNLRQVLEGEFYDDLFDDAPRDVKVAVIDIYPGSQGHPDLVNRYETGINTVERDGSGNPTTNTNPPTWDGLAAAGSNAHGQCVASVIAGEHRNGGLAGVFHRARIIPVRASFNTLDEAIDLAVAAGAEVIHIAGWHNDFFTQEYVMYPDYWPPSQYPLRWTMKNTATANYERARAKAIREAVERASWDHNVIISTVVGNWDGRHANVLLPSIHETISTMAVNVLGEPSPFNANFHGATILAPGGDRRTAPWLPHAGNWISGGFGSSQDDIPCAIGPDRYSWGSGGSFAGPHTAAAIAIIKSYLPDATPADVRRLLVRSMQPLQTLNLHLLQSVGGMLSLKRLKDAIDAE